MLDSQKRRGLFFITVLRYTRANSIVKNSSHYIKLNQDKQTHCTHDRLFYQGTNNQHDYYGLNYHVRGDVGHEKLLHCQAIYLPLEVSYDAAQLGSCPPAILSRYANHF